MSKQYALYKIESTLGKLNGTQIYYLYFVDVDYYNNQIVEH